MSKLLINRKKFIKWFFNDYDSRREFFNDYDVENDLLKDGEFILTAEELLSNVGYIPSEVVEKGQSPILDAEGEVDMSKYKEIFYS